MRIRSSEAAALVLAGVLVASAACRGSNGEETTAGGAPPEAVAQMKAPESPYYIIYHPPVNLGKQPDTTARGRKP